MSTKIQIEGDWKQKFEVGPINWHNHGSFHFAKAIGPESWSQSQGLLTVTETIDHGVVTVTLSAFGHTFAAIKESVVGSNRFKLELDSGNLVEGTATVTDDATNATLPEGAKLTV